MSTAARLGARSFEGLVGGVLGAGLGGAAGALAYEPKRPREWSDEHGNIYDRPLSREEKKTRLQIAAAAALAGALGGAGATLGGSGLLRARVTAMERQKAQQVADEFLQPLRYLIDDWKGYRDATRATNIRGGGTGRTAIGKEQDRQVREARILLQQQEKKVKDLVDEAARRRAHLPFIGGLPDSPIGSGIDWRPMAHGGKGGVVSQHFDMLAKKQGFPEMNLDNADKVFSSAVTARMSKVSSAAFYAELEKIGYTPPAFGGSLGAMGATKSVGAKLPSMGKGLKLSKPAKLTKPPTPKPAPGV